MEVLVLKVVGDVAAGVIDCHHVAQALIGDRHPVVAVADQTVLAYHRLVARPAAADVLKVSCRAAAKVNAGTVAAVDAVAHDLGAFACLQPDAVRPAPVHDVGTDADAQAQLDMHPVMVVADHGQVVYEAPGRPDDPYSIGQIAYDAEVRAGNDSVAGIVAGCPH